MYGKQKTQRNHIKTTLDYKEVKKKRSERHITLRKKRRQEHLAKRRKEDVGAFDEEIKKQIHQIPSYLQKIKSQDVKLQLEATVFFRKLLSIEKTPPIDSVVKSNVVPFLVSFLLKNNEQQLQFEALWAITNICSGNKVHINAVIQTNAIPILVKLISSQSVEVKEQAIWALGNISGEGPTYRDYVLRSAILLPLLSVLKTPNLKLSCLKNAVWTLSNLCRGKPAPKFDMIKHCLPYLAKLIKSKESEVIVDSLWAISYISDGDNEKINAIIEQKIVKTLIELLYHPSPAVQTPALRTIGNIVTGTDEQTQVVIQNGGLNGIRNILNHTKRSIQKEAVWTISNITAGPAQQIQCVFDANIFQPLIKIVGLADFEIRREAAWAISNATSSATEAQIATLVKLGCIKPLCDLLTIDDTTIVVVALEGLDNILKAGKVYEKRNNTANPFAQFVEKAQGVQKLEGLQHHPSREVYNKAIKLLEKYFELEEDNNELDNYSFMENVDKDNYTFE